MDKIKLQNYCLKMLAGIEMPESKLNEVTKKWEKTGNKILAFEYTIIKNDITKNKLIILSNCE